MISIMADSNSDIEKKLQPETVTAVTAVETEPAKPSGFFARIRYYEELLDRKLGIESHSLDRVHPEDRYSPSPLVMAFMWASATMNISCFSTGFLGMEFGLSLGQTIPIVIFATFLGAAVTVCLVFQLMSEAMQLTRIRAGVLLWARALVCARWSSPDTRLASIHHPSSPH